MTGLSILVRFVQLAAGAQLLGALLFLLLVWRPARARALPAPASTEDASGAWVDRALLRLASWAVLASLAAGVAALGLQAARAAGDAAAAWSPVVVGELLTGTQYGTAWLVRMAALGLLGAFLLLRERERDGKDWWALRLEAAGLGAVAFAGVAWTGHAATAEAWRPLAADATHLLATALWVGGLTPLALVLGSVRTEPTDPRTVAVVVEASRRFSAIALGGMILLVGTGLLNGGEQVGGVPALVGTAYGRLLLLKLALLVPALGLAAVNRVGVLPRLGNDAGTARVELARLRRNVLLEAALGLGMLLVVAALGLTPPARHVPPSWPFSVRLAWDVTRTLPGVQTRVAVGSQLAVLGLVAALVAVVIRRRRWAWIAGAGSLAIVLGLAVALPPLAVDAYPTTYLRPPIAYTAISIARGLDLYRTHCVACHGVAGYGDGPAAAGLPRRPADLTAQHTADHTVGDLYWWLSHGIPAAGMPGFADRLGPDDRWDLINFLRTLAAAEQARGLGPVVEPTAWLVAPDFSFTTGVGEARSLKDFRGQAIVLLVLFTLPDSVERLVALNGAYRSLRLLGAEIVAIPVGVGAEVYRALAGQPVFFPIALDGAFEAATTYLLVRRDLTAEGQRPEPPLPRHMELLVDRQGYLRGRFIPGAAKDGWTDPARLVAEVERLAKEAPRGPAPDEHIH
jgi:putative copper resistance protein D